MLVTGGAGFIGSFVVDLLLERDDRVSVLDKLTYAGARENLVQHEGEDRFNFVQGDVCDPSRVELLVAAADRVIHAAAESFVDRSIADARVFVETNVLGTHVVLEACRRTGTPLLFVSTDEVYGSRTDGRFAEDDALRPNSPYAASKAGADLLCRAYHVTYGLEVTVVRGANAYGPRQHPEKAIPTFTLAALEGRPVPVYGDGSNRREWLFVRDFAAAVLSVLEDGEPGEAYNIGGGFELSNLELARRICDIAGTPGTSIELVPDRPGHDFRYSLDWSKLAALGWKPQMGFDAGLETTVDWYRRRARQEVSP